MIGPMAHKLHKQIALGYHAHVLKYAASRGAGDIFQFLLTVLHEVLIIFCTP